MSQSIRYTTLGVSTLWLLVLSWGFTTRHQAQQAPLLVTPVALVQSSLSGANLVSEEGQVDPHLLAFLDLYSLKHDGTVASVDQAMQENFLRKPGTERRDLANSQLDTKVQAEAMDLLSQMELVEEIPHTHVNVDYFLLFGAMLPKIETRLTDFIQQYNQGTLHCKNIVL
ncbi:MAG: hypothetical protein AAFP00_08745, partial [Bacteroidota bacterium]